MAKAAAEVPTPIVPETQALIDEALTPSKAPRHAVTALQAMILEGCEALHDQARAWKRCAMAMDRVEQVPEIRGRAPELTQTAAAWEREIAVLEAQTAKVMSIEAQFHRIMAEVVVLAETAGYKVKK